jgi:hypothetical protein
MAAPSFEFRALDAAAKRRIASSSVAPVAQGYVRPLRPCAARFSPPQHAIFSGGDR